VALVLGSVHVSGGALLVGAGIAFALLAATGPGPLSVARVCTPRLHAVLDVVVALCLALAPVLPAMRPDATGVVVAEFAAIGWLRLTTLTRFASRKRDEPAP
jgi:hypothetical protein